MAAPLRESVIVELPVLPDFFLHWLADDPVNSFLWGVNLLVDAGIALLDFLLPGDYLMLD